MVLYDIINWTGLNIDDVLSMSYNFWSTPAGITVSFTIMLCSTIYVFSRRIKDTLFERVWHSCVAMIMMCAVVAGVSPTSNPHYFVKTLLLFWAVRHVHEVWYKLKGVNHE